VISEIRKRMLLKRNDKCLRVGNVRLTLS